MAARVVVWSSRAPDEHLDVYESGVLVNVGMRRFPAEVPAGSYHHC